MLHVLQPNSQIPFIPKQTSTPLTAEGSPLRVLEFFEAEVLVHGLPALYAAAAWEVPVSRKILPSFDPWILRPVRCKRPIRLSPEAGQARPLDPSVLSPIRHGCNPLVLRLGLCRSSGIVSPGSLAFILSPIGAGFGALAAAAEQEQTSAPFYMG